MLVLPKPLHASSTGAETIQTLVTKTRADVQLLLTAPASVPAQLSQSVIFCSIA
jgi:hypothetical protein